MDEQERLASEKLVQVQKARNEWEASILVGYLQNNGIEATLEAKVSRARAGADAGFCDPDPTSGVFVLEHDADRARRIVEEFSAAAFDEKVLEETAAQHLKLDRETIARLRGELREERDTFRFLGWVAAAFLAAAAMLWAEFHVYDPVARWLTVLVLAVAAGVAVNRAGTSTRR